MPSFNALAGLGVIWALAGCFKVNNFANCRITCSADDQCPSGLTCDLEHGLCTPEGTKCLDTTDAGPDATDATDAMDAGDAGTDRPVEPPQVLCRGGGDANNCLTLPESVRSNLVLLLWPSNLSTVVGSPVNVWPDQSGKGNDAHAFDVPAHVVADGVQLDRTQMGSRFEVADNASLDLGSGDFAIFMVAGLVSNNQPVILFLKSDAAPANPRQVALAFEPENGGPGVPIGVVNDVPTLISNRVPPQPSVAVYSLRRRGDHAELRLNTEVVASADLPAGTSTTNSEDILIGSVPFGYVADSISAVIIVKGPAATNDLDNLESFLRTFAVASP